jgi:hypothetical protein
VFDCVNNFLPTSLHLPERLVIGGEGDLDLAILLAEEEPTNIWFKAVFTAYDGAFGFSACKVRASRETIEFIEEEQVGVTNGD